MVKLLAIFISSAVVLTSAAAQFQVLLQPAYSVFICGESVVVQLELQNDGRDTINVNPVDGKDKFVVEIMYGERYNELQLLTEAPFCKPFELKPAPLSRLNLKSTNGIRSPNQGSTLLS